MSKTTIEHKKRAPQKIRFGIVILSSSRYKKMLEKKEVKDETGKILVSELEKENHVVVFYTVLPDHKGMMQAFMNYASQELEFDSIIVSGGTGVSSKDVTIESLREISSKELEGFGEVFRARSLREIGEAIILSRASAFIINEKIVYAIPGSPHAARMALPIILAETGHILMHLGE